MKAYGPVPSRRLGRSLGVNNIPPKVCSYSCIYCQLGAVKGTFAERKEFYPPEELVTEIKRVLGREKPNYITFVPDGEPTLDINLGREIELLKPLGIKIAVITNSSLLWRDDVIDDLKKADWVSLKVDAVKEKTWRKINRPCKSLELEKILDGIRRFAKEFRGELTTETMLIDDVNDSDDELKETAGFISGLKPSIAYLSIPTRPPAEAWATPPPEKRINKAYQIFSEKIRQVRHLIGYEGNEFSSTGDVEEDLLSITSVHPMREDAVRKLLEKNNKGWDLVERLLEDEKLVELRYMGWRFYMRKLPTRG
ncbi:MAG: radical SAM protein [Candidatus Altiarchaeota archaeon]|nr:radical SAM protein [Candidatus Altiarchaeota archaeon]